MKPLVNDPWNSGHSCNGENATHFEDSFVINQCDKLSDSQQYLDRLYARLENLKGGSSKKDLVNSLSKIKEDSIARFITGGDRLESEDEGLLAANPLIRHIAPHLQALTSNELIHLLKADILQVVTDEQHEKIEEKIEVSQEN